MADLPASIPPDAINLSFERVFCSRHGEPLRSAWPAGYPIVLAKLFDDVFRQRETLAEARKASGEDKPDPKLIESLLDVTPLCCRVSDRRMVEIYKYAGFGVKAKCSNCRRKRLGAPYKTTISSRTHVCFDCVIYSMEPVQ